jgi:hypothetical protein
MEECKQDGSIFMEHIPKKEMKILKAERKEINI